MLAPKREYWYETEGEPLPGADAVGRPVSAIMTLRCDSLVPFELTREICEDQ